MCGRGEGGLDEMQVKAWTLDHWVHTHTSNTMSNSFVYMGGVRLHTLNSKDKIKR